MDIKVREVTAEEKSSQEIEQELLDKHEQKQEQDAPVQQEEEKSVESASQPAQVEVTESLEADKKEEEDVKEGEVEAPTEEIKEEQPPELKEIEENDVLSYIGQRYGKEINSIDELISAREEGEKLPEDVATYLKYKKETGRGISDYAKLQKDYSDLSPEIEANSFLLLKLIVDYPFLSSKRYLY